MLEFHGWITIHESIEEVDQGHLDEIVEELKQHIFNLNWNSHMLNIYATNGEYHLSTGGLFNRKTTELLEVVNIYHLIAKKAPGSYGLLYIRDDEDTEGIDNEFQVYVLSRGQVSIEKDNFLSPFVP